MLNLSEAFNRHERNLIANDSEVREIIDHGFVLVQLWHDLTE